MAKLPELTIGVNFTRCDKCNRVEVVQCAECKHWFEEDLMRCNALRQKPFGWCCRKRKINETDHTDITYFDDFCSYGERRTGNG